MQASCLSAAALRCHTMIVRDAMRFSYCLSFCALIVSCSAMMEQPALAQLAVARLDAIVPAGGKQGSQVEVSLAGLDLDGVSQLQFSHPGITATQKTQEKNGKPVPVKNEFVVNIAADVPVGTYEARSTGDYGISSPRAFVVSDRPEVVEKEPNDSVQQAMPVEMESVINGVIKPSDFDYFRFQASQGERIIIQCDAEKIDSYWEPVLTLYNAQGQQLLVNGDTTFRTRVIDFTVPESGEYILRVNDMLYAEARYVGVRNKPWLYRFTLTRGAYVDFVYPPTGMPGSTGKYYLYGRNLPKGEIVAEATIDGKPLERQAVEITLPQSVKVSESIDTFLQLRYASMVAAPSPSTQVFAYRLPTTQYTCNPVFISLATAPLVAEQEPNNVKDSAQSLNVPCEVYGQFAQVEDRDYFQFDASKDQVFQIEVISQRLGIATDPFLVIEHLQSDGKIKELASVDDQDLAGISRQQRATDPGRYSYNTRTDDPAYRFVAPADGTYRVLVRDMYYQTRGDQRFLYRLSIREEQPDFEVITTTHYPEDLRPQNRNREPWSTLLRRGGTERFDVLALRTDGFDGAIEVNVDGLPDGVTCTGTVLPPGESAATMVLRASQDVKPWQGAIRVTATAIAGGESRTKTSWQSAVVSLGRTARFIPRARRTHQTVLSVTDEQAPCLVEIGEENVITAVAGEAIKIPVKVTRYGDFKSSIQLNAVALPQNIKTKPVNIPASKTSAEVDLTINKKATLGRQNVLFEVKTSVDYIRDKSNPKAKPSKITMYTPATQILLDITPPAEKAAEKK